MPQRLLETHNQKVATLANQAKAERLAGYGQMRFEEYAAEWKQGQHHLAPASVDHLDSLLQNHLFPAFASRLMNTFDHKVVDGFIRTTERNTVGLATQSNALDKLKAIMLDAHRLGLFEEGPLLGGQAPVYDPKRPSSRRPGS
ncbi:hypothetical protein [Streptomyces virginiae]|uniref:hypothetical protein n=1 Tax=Streptomyces virginiae TaxID=1961 RepID=UPI0036818326